MRCSLEEDVTRLDVGEEQAVYITCDSRALNLLVLCNLLVESHVERKRTVNHHITQLTTITHLCEDSALEVRLNGRQHLLGSRDAGDFRSSNAQLVGSLGKELDLHLLLLEVGSGDNRNVRDNEQLVVARKLNERNVSQDTLRGNKTLLLIEDATHILVGRNQTLHQNICSTSLNRCNSHSDSLCILLNINDIESGNGDIQLCTHLLDNRLITIESRLNKTLLVCVINSLDCV